MNRGLTFSSRVPWDLRPNRLSRLLEEKRRSGVSILDLTESNPTAAGFDYPPEVLEALAGPRGLVYEPAPAGLASARQAVSRYYRARGEDVSAERVLLATSTSESYSYLFKLLCGPGDEILAPRPSYPLFEFLAALESVRVVQYPLRYHGEWSIDLEALESAVTARSRAVVVVNPNNPTGSFLKRSELERLAALGLPVIADEVFADYAFGPDERRVASLASLESVPVFCLSGLSKVSALPQMKLGWIVANNREACERLELIADTYLSVSTPVQHALPALLEARIPMQAQIKARLRRNLEFLRASIAGGSAVRVLEVEGGWCATLQVPRVKSEEEWVLDLLEARHVLVQPGFFYDFESEAYLVLSLLTREDVFEKGVRHLLERIDTRS